MNCNGDFSHLRNGKQKNQSSSYPSAESRSASQIAALDNDSPEAPEPLHFDKQHVVLESRCETRMQMSWLVPHEPAS
jgi:hypothetical protein